MEDKKDKHRISINMDIEFYNYILANKNRMSVSQYCNVLLEEYFTLKAIDLSEYEDK